MLIRSPLTERAPRGVAARAGVCGAVLGAVLAAALVAPALSSAAPTLSLSAKIVPVPGFHGSGNCLGCGADLEAEIGITSTEYFGGPPPIEEVKGYYPKGTKINTHGFTTCTAASLEAKGTAGCPHKSAAGPPGATEGFVSLGGERVPETVQVTPFLVSGGGLDFWIEGNTPVKIEKLATGSWSFPASGPVISVHVPLIETLPGAPDASATHIKTKFGGAVKKGHKTTYYGTVPKSCPKGGFPGKVEIKFMGVASPVSAETKVPCPPSKGKKKK
jgi:hypothetical protein